MTYSPDMVFYHYPCVDGVTAAAIVQSRFGTDGIEYVPTDYNRFPPVEQLIELCRGKHVLLVDLSFKPEAMERVEQSATSIVVIDHHKSAIERLAHYESVSDLTVGQLPQLLEQNKVVCCFDIKQCGASLTYQVLWPDNTMPAIIDMVRTVDLHLDPNNPDVEAFKYWSRSYPMTPEQWREFLDWDDNELDAALEEGQSIARFVRTRIDQIEPEARTGYIGGVAFQWAITDYALSSDVANRFVSNGFQLGAAVYFGRNGMGVSLRSARSLDCSRIAEQFGGGGHAQASGFNIGYADLAGWLEAAQSGEPPLISLAPIERDAE